MIAGQEVLELAEREGFQRAHLLNSGKDSFLVCALSSYRREPDDLSTPQEPHALIAPFARRNYYREAVKRLKRIAVKIREKTGLAKQDIRILCNSGTAEKPLAVASGLGFYGKNSLVISPGLGSQFIIAAMSVELTMTGNYNNAVEPPEGSGCGDCRACISACPVGAIVKPGVLDQKRCLQYLAARPDNFTLPVKRAWAYRLYGCRSCQEVCPFNGELSLETETEMGDLGPSIAISSILSCRAEEIRRLFKGTQMGLSWVDPAALLRNALIAAGNRRNPGLLPYVEPFTGSSEAVLRESALWALKEIREA
ncbi:MAG: 4Fe-4S dicluster domain-containing protein [Spirochaeta sp.]|nr:4Fe-4S dicluster domain-containing protein [Spirochaeta sp.]